MPRKNARPAARKRHKKRKLRLATKDGRELPSHFRSRNPNLSHSGLAMAYLVASLDLETKTED